MPEDCLCCALVWSSLFSFVRESRSGSKLNHSILSDFRFPTIESNMDIIATVSFYSMSQTAKALNVLTFKPTYPGGKPKICWSLKPDVCFVTRRWFPHILGTHGDKHKSGPRVALRRFQLAEFKPLGRSDLRSVCQGRLRRLTAICWAACLPCHSAYAHTHLLEQHHRCLSFQMKTLSSRLGP